MATVIAKLELLIFKLYIMNKSIQKLVLFTGSLLIVAVSLFAFNSNQSEKSFDQAMLQNSQNGVELAALESNLVDMGIYSIDNGNKCGEGKCGEGKCGEGKTKESAKKGSKKESKKESKKGSKKETKSAKSEKSSKKAESKCGTGKCGGSN
jgi:uncharacterized low-complexity protein